MFLLLRAIFRKVSSVISCGAIHRFWYVHAGKYYESDSCSVCGVVRDRPWEFMD